MSLNCKKIGVMGGMFDPVHNGHLRTALVAQESLLLDEVLLIPCGVPSHRCLSIANNSQRIEMLGLGINGLSSFRVDDRECQAEDTSYIIDSLLSLKKENPNAVLFLILGTDSFNTMPEWHQWLDIFSVAHVLVFARPGWKLKETGEIWQEFTLRQAQSVQELEDVMAGKIFVIDFAPLKISSSQIRKLIEGDKSPEFLLPSSVWQYIRAEKLYSRKY